MKYISELVTLCDKKRYSAALKSTTAESEDEQPKVISE